MSEGIDADGAPSKKLRRQWKIYTDPVVSEEEAKKLEPILSGCKGETMLDAGIIYAPYVPLQVTGAKPAPKSPLEEFVEEVFKEEVDAGTLKPLPREISAGVGLDEFSLRKGLRTRYQKTLINPDFFGTVSVGNL